MRLKNYSPTENKVGAVAERIVGELGYTIWDIRFEKEGASMYLRVYIDKEDGIDIDDCVKVSHPLDKELDVIFKDIPWDFFEVCSPGSERELTRRSHFESYIGSEIAVKTIRPIDNVREFEGILEEIDDDSLKIAGDNAISIRFADIASVKTIDNKPYEGEEL